MIVFLLLSMTEKNQIYREVDLACVSSPFGHWLLMGRHDNRVDIQAISSNNYVGFVWVCAHVYGHTCTGAHEHVCICMYRPEVDFSQVSVWGSVHLID